MSPRASTAYAEAIASAPPATTFPILTPSDPARFYPRFGPLPGVVAVHDQTGGWDVPGQTRTLELSDGGTVVENLDVVDGPAHFAYHLTDFTGPFGRLVDHAEADWTFVAEGEGRTRIGWRYTYIARPGWTWAVTLVVRLFWAPYMRRVLPGLVAEVARVTA